MTDPENGLFLFYAKRPMSELNKQKRADRLTNNRVYSWKD